MRSNHGFTLMELMVTLVIVAILAAVAIPSYTQYIQRARRVEARVALDNGMNVVQKFFLQNGRYPADNVEFGIAGPTEHGYYQIDYALAADPTVTASVIASGSQAQDLRCQFFALSASGARSAKDSATADSTAECW